MIPVERPSGDTSHLSKDTHSAAVVFPVQAVIEDLQRLDMERREDFEGKSLIRVLESRRLVGCKNN